MWKVKRFIVETCVLIINKLDKQKMYFAVSETDVHIKIEKLITRKYSNIVGTYQFWVKKSGNKAESIGKTELYKNGKLKEKVFYDDLTVIKEDK
jgi:hypothetical protein